MSGTFISHSPKDAALAGSFDERLTHRHERQLIHLRNNDAEGPPRLHRLRTQTRAAMYEPPVK
jgi:hypothetical protein